MAPSTPKTNVVAPAGTLVLPELPYDVVHSKSLDSVRVKMPGGVIYQWSMIDRPEGLERPEQAHIDLLMGLPAVHGHKSAEYRAIQNTFREETRRQLGNAIYTTVWKLVHRRIKDYVVAKAQAKHPILLRFRNDWASYELMRRAIARARNGTARVKKTLKVAVDDDCVKAACLPEPARASQKAPETRRATRSMARKSTGKK